MQQDERIHVFGLGTTYPNGADGTTAKLAERFPLRVHDTPCSEAAVTGMAVGMAAAGLHPIVHHGRVEFALYALDAIVTQAAKWNYMFGGDYPCPLVLRIAVGRQWGNGPQHTQALHGLFGAVPGLQVVVPSSPAQAKGLLLAACREPNPVVFLEHRWLYKLRQYVPPQPYTVRLDSAQMVRSGEHVTILTIADGLIETLKAVPAMLANKISPEIIDLACLNPIDHRAIQISIAKTRRLLIVTTDHLAFGLGAEVERIALEHAVAAGFYLEEAPRILALPAIPCPTAPALTAAYYPHASQIADAATQLVTGDPFSPAAVVRPTFQELHLPPTDTLDELS